jgi:hypothetical protein
MNTDYGVNVVVFEVKVGRRLEKVLGECSTRDADGIRSVWGELATAFNLRPAAVRRVYCQWEPTPDDRAFLAATFPRAVKVSYSFRRPPARRDWGNKPTEEFGRAVDDFWRAWEERERAKSATGVAKAGPRRPGGPRRPWWQYWDWPAEGSNPLTGERR